MHKFMIMAGTHYLFNNFVDASITEILRVEQHKVNIAKIWFRIMSISTWTAMC